MFVSRFALSIRMLALAVCLGSMTTLVSCAKGGFNEPMSLDEDFVSSLAIEPTEELVPSVPVVPGQKAENEVYDIRNVKFGADKDLTVITARVELVSVAGVEIVEMAGRIRDNGSATLIDMKSLTEKRNRLTAEAHVMSYENCKRLSAEERKGTCDKIILNIHFKVGKENHHKQFVSGVLAKSKPSKTPGSGTVSADGKSSGEGTKPKQGGDSSSQGHGSQGAHDQTTPDDPDKDMEPEDDMGEYVGAPRNEAMIDELEELPEAPVVKPAPAPAPAPATPTGSSPAPAKPVEQKPKEQKPVETKPVVTKPVEQKPKDKEQKPAETKPTEPKQKEQKPAETKPAEQKPAVQQPPAPKPEEQEDEDKEPEQQKPAEQKPVEQKPVEHKPVEQKPAEQKPAEQKPVEQKPAENQTPAKPSKTEPEKEKPVTPAQPAKAEPVKPKPPVTPVIPEAPSKDSYIDKLLALEKQLAPMLDLRGGGQAVDSINDGSLRNGTLLAESGPGFRTIPGKREKQWGTGMMISLLKNAAEFFERTWFKGSFLYIGDISQKHGGHLTGTSHKSHQNGLDVDIPYVGNDKFVSVIDGNGRIKSNFDYQKNWQFFRLVASQRIVQDGKKITVLNRIFVNPIIKKALCNWAESVDLLKDPFDADIMRRIQPWEAHHDHFHLRIRCSPHYPECRNQLDGNYGC